MAQRGCRSKHTLALTNRRQCHGSGSAELGTRNPRRGDRRGSASSWSPSRSSWGASCELGAVRRLGATPVVGQADDQGRSATVRRSGWRWNETTRDGGIPAESLPHDGIGEFDYGFVLDDSDTVLPDPRSRRQPQRVHGWSRTFDADQFSWSDQQWDRHASLPAASSTSCTSVPSPREGTLTAAIDRLDHLVELGDRLRRADAGERFRRSTQLGLRRRACGTRCTRGYGGPLGYMQFVDACHRRGLASDQDVVYNHLGSERQLPAAVRART